MANEGNGVREDFRPPTEREQEILQMLLTVEAEGIEELRAQVPFTRVARWDCGCASFSIQVDCNDAPRSSITRSPAVEAQTKERGDVTAAFDLLLWVDDGWLAGVEIVDYVDLHGMESPADIPPPGAWEAPQLRR